MAITQSGLSYLSQATVGQGTFFNATNARLGVGDGTAAFAATQNDLQGANKLRKAMDAGYPTVSGPTINFKATFAPAEANFAWNEWGVFNAQSGGIMLNRVRESNGTKQSNQTWILEVAITFTLGT